LVEFEKGGKLFLTMLRIAGRGENRGPCPVLLASGYDEASVMQGDHPERPQAFLAKPYGPPDLRKAIAKALLGRWEDTTEDSASDAEGRRLFPDI
jgi:CheY-like chemotaxis protein